MNILVTGATGFIGKNLIIKLLNSNFKVTCIVRRDSDTSVIDQRAVKYIYDRDINQLIEFCQEQQFEGVIHLASLFINEHTTEDISTLIHSNVLFGTQLLEVCKKTNIKWFLNTGTFWQHYNNETYNPVNLYAATKEAFENIAKYYTQTSDIIFTTIKLNDTFGLNDTRNKVFNLWNKISKSGETLEMSPGDQRIDISYIEDIIEGYILLIELLNGNEAKKYNNQSFVITNETKLSLKELAHLYQDITEKKLHIKWGRREYRDREVMIPYNKGQTIPNWKQKYTLKQAILTTLGKNNE